MGNSNCKDTKVNLSDDSTNLFYQSIFPTLSPQLQSYLQQFVSPILQSQIGSILPYTYVDPIELLDNKKLPVCTANVTISQNLTDLTNINLYDWNMSLYNVSGNTQSYYIYLLLGVDELRFAVEGLTGSCSPFVSQYPNSCTQVYSPCFEQGQSCCFGIPNFRFHVILECQNTFTTPDSSTLQLNINSWNTLFFTISHDPVSLTYTIFNVGPKTIDVGSALDGVIRDNDVTGNAIAQLNKNLPNISFKIPTGSINSSTALILINAFFLPTIENLTVKPTSNLFAVNEPGGMCVTNVAPNQPNGQACFNQFLPNYSFVTYIINGFTLYNQCYACRFYPVDNQSQFVVPQVVYGYANAGPTNNYVNWLFLSPSLLTLSPESVCSVNFGGSSGLTMQYNNWNKTILDIQRGYLSVDVSTGSLTYLSEPDPVNSCGWLLMTTGLAMSDVISSSNTSQNSQMPLAVMYWNSVNSILGYLVPTASTSNGIALNTNPATFTDLPSTMNASIYVITDYPVRNILVANNTGYGMTVQGVDLNGTTYNTLFMNQGQLTGSSGYVKYGYLEVSLNPYNAQLFPIRLERPTQVIVSCDSIQFYDENNSLLPSISKSGLTLCS